MKRLKIFYGWYIAGGSILMQTLTSGFAVYTFGLFAVPLLGEFGWARGELYLAQTMSIGIGGLISPLIGRWVDKYGIKGLMSFGAVMFGTLMALLSLTNSIWYFYGINILLAMAGPAIGHIPVNTMVAHWFDKKRGFVTGLVTTGVGLGGIILAPVAALLISSHGWRSSYVILGIICAVIMFPLAFFVMRLKPSEMGLAADGRAPEKENDPAQAQLATQTETSQASWALHDALRIRVFWLIFVVFFLFRFSLHGVLHHMVPYYVGKGVSTSVSAAMVSCIAAMGIVGKLIGGYAGDRTGARVVGFLSLPLLGGSVALLLIGDSITAYRLFAIAFGFFMGVLTPILLLMISYCFGDESFGTLLGTIFLAHSAGVGLGPLFSGFLFDLTGSYQLAYSIYIALLVAAGVAVFWVRPPKPAVPAESRAP